MRATTRTLSKFRGSSYRVPLSVSRLAIIELSRTATRATAFSLKTTAFPVRTDRNNNVRVTALKSAPRLRVDAGTVDMNGEGYRPSDTGSPTDNHGR